jgi:hypothetical protein
MKLGKLASTKRVGPVAWPGALGLIVCMSLAPGIARAEDDDLNSIWNLDKKIIYEVLRSFNMTPKRHLDEQIEYHERSPLVVPPSRVPPVPQARAAARDPNWPVEADVNHSREAAEKRTKKRQEFDPDAFTNPLPPSELGGAATAVPNRSAGGDADMTDTLRPSQLGSPGGLFGGLFGGNTSRQEQQVGTLAAEPPRARLVEPPAGYRTPSPGQPYGVTPPAGYGKPTKHEDLAVGDEGP